MRHTFLRSLAVLVGVTMLVIGLGVGAAAYGGAHLLLVSFNDSPEFHDFVKIDFGKNFYDAQGTPLLPAYLAYFAALFAGIRWWKQADPWRISRLSVWGTLVCVLWAWMLHVAWPFPQPWGVMLTATIAVSVQLASPWISLEARKAARLAANR